MPISYIVSNDIVHESTRAGSGFVVTRCLTRIDLRGALPVPAVVKFGSGFPTSAQGHVCKSCFADFARNDKK